MSPTSRCEPAGSKSADLGSEGEPKMKRNPSFACKILFCAVSALLIVSWSDLALGFEWEKRVGLTGRDEIGRSVQETAGGGYIIAGSRRNPDTGTYSVHLIKTDDHGNLLWDRAFGGAADDRGESVQQVTDGGFIITGYTSSAGAGQEDVYLIKTDGSGNALWSQTFGGAGQDAGFSVQETSDNGFIIAGCTTSSGAGEGDIYLIRTDSTGTELWSRTFGGADWDCGFSVQETTGGGFIIAGYTDSFDGGVSKVALVKTDASGVEEWSRRFGGANVARAYSVQETTGGGYIVAGWVWSFQTGNYDVYLIKTEGNGDLVTSRTYGGSGDDWGYSVRETTDGGFIVAGSTYSFGAGQEDLYLLRTNSIGNVLQAETFGGSRQDAGYCVQQTADGGYVAVGDTQSGDIGPNNVYLVYYNSNFVPPSPDVRANLSAGPISVNTGDPVSITVSMNPGDVPSVMVDWWVVAETPFGYQSYVWGQGWEDGIRRFILHSLIEVSPPVEVYNDILPGVGTYTFYFGVDDPDNHPEPAVFKDTVVVNVVP